MTNAHVISRFRRNEAGTLQYHTPGTGGKWVDVTSGGGGGPATWGAIIGTLGDQNDLVAALAAKENTGVAAALIAAHLAASDPHPIYLTQTEANALYDALGAASAAVAAHVAAGDPHPTYLTQAEADALYDALGAAAADVAAHEAAANPHPQYISSQSNQVVSAANGSFAFQTLSLSNANGVSFGTSAGSAITASVNAQSAQTLGLYASSNTTGQSSSSTFDARSISFQGLGILSVGFSGNKVMLSVPSGGGAGDGVNILAAGTQTANTTGTVVLSNSNNVSFGMNNSSVITASASFAAQTNQTLGGYAVGNTTGQSSSSTIDARSLSFDGAGIVSLGFSNGTLRVSATQSNQAFSAQGGSSAFQTLVFTNSNGVSFSNTNGSVWGSVAAQTAQTLGVYATSNTTGQSSSSTYDARSLTVRGYGIASIGHSNGSILVSTPDAVDFTYLSVGNSNLGNTAGDTGVFSQRMVLVGSNNITLSGSSNGGSVTLSIIGGAGAGNISVGNSNLGNTAGDTGVFTGRVVFVGSNNITLSGSSNGGSATLSIIGGAGGGGVGLSAGTQSVSTGTVIFSNSNNITFGMSGSSRVTASAALGLYATGNTTQSSSTVRPIDSVSFNALGAMTVGFSNGSVQLSAPATSSLSATGNASISVNGSTISIGANAAAVSLSGNSTSAGAGYSNVSTGTLILAGGANITLSQNGASVSIIGGAGGGGADGFNNIAAGTQTAATTGTVMFSNSNNVSFGMSNSSIVTASASFPAQTNQTIGFYGSSQTTGQSSSSTVDARSITFRGAGAVSVGLSGGEMIISAPNTIAQTAQTQSNVQGIIVSNTTYRTGDVSFSNLNGASFGSNGANVITLSYTVPTVTNSSWTVSDAATSATVGRLAFSNANGITLGLSTSNNGNHTVTGSHNALTTARASNDAIGLNTAQTNVTWTVNSSGVSLNAGGYAGTASGFTGANISATITHNSVGLSLSLSVAAPGAAAEANAIQLLGANTAGNTTATGSTIGWSGVNLTLSGTNASQVVISAPATSSLVGTNGVSISVNGSTISFGQNIISKYENAPLFGSSLLTWNGASVSHAQPFLLPMPLSASFIRVPGLMTTNSTTIATLVSASATAQGALFSTINAVLYSQGTGANSQSLISFASGSGGFTMSQQISVTNSTQGSYSLGVTQQAGGVTNTLTTQYSISNTNYSFTTDQIATNFSSVRFFDVPFANSLTPGHYWMVMGMSSSSSSAGAGGLAALTNCNVRYQGHYGNSVGVLSVGVMGATNRTSNIIGGASFSTAGGGTTSALPVSALSSMASNAGLYFQLLRSV